MPRLWLTRRDHEQVHVGVHRRAGAPHVSARRRAEHPHRDEPVAEALGEQVAVAREARALGRGELRHAVIVGSRRMGASREGGCACGAVRYRLASAPLFVHCCHCLNCQRQTGSAFVVNLLIEADRVEVLEGAPEVDDLPRDDGPPQRVFRCPACRIALFSEYSSPKVRFVRAGTLDDPRGIAPDVHIFTRSKVDWVVLPPDVPAFEVYYDVHELWPADSRRRLDAALNA
jgi:hypothetical protein